MKNTNLLSLLSLPLAAAFVSGCVIHLGGDDLAPESTEILDAQITSRASARILVTTPWDNVGVEAFEVTVSYDDAESVRQTVAADAFYGSSQWLDITGLRPGAENTIAVSAVDYAGNTSITTSVGPFVTDFAYSGAVLPADPDNGDHALGYAMARGDFNSDGYSDVAVAAPFRTFGGYVGAGAVTIHHGGPGGIAMVPDLVVGGTEAYAQFGNALAALDWDGDGSDDLAIGAPFANSGAGAVYIYTADRLAAPGEFAGNATSEIVSDGTGWYEGAAIGFALASLDADDDGRDDLAIAAVAGGDDGGVILLHGNSASTDVALSETAANLGGLRATRLRSPTPTELFGVTMAAIEMDAGDALAISGFQTGSVVVFSGSSSDHSTAIVDRAWNGADDLHVLATELGPDAYVGASLGSITTGAGPELLIGAYRANDGAGLVAMVPADLTGTHDLGDVAVATVAGATNGQLGSAIANNAHSTADVDGDGTEDLVLIGGTGELELLVWYGGDLPVGETSASSAHYTLAAPVGMVGDIPSIGGSPATAAWVGDVDGDGLEDLAWADWTGNASDGLFELLR